MRGTAPSLVLRAVGAVTAAGPGVDAMWRAICDARPLAQPVTRYDVEGLSVRRAAVVPAALDDAFAARWPHLDDLSVRLAYAAVDDAFGGAPWPRDAGLYLGTSLGGTASWEPWHRAMVRGENLRPPACAAHADTAVALARALDLRGPVVTVSTACTSSSAALVMAADAIAEGLIDDALVVGVDALGRFVHAGFERLGALTPDHLAPAPFAADRAGMWLGEGAAAVWLSRSGAAVARYLGGSAAGDGVHMTAPDRAGDGMRRAIEDALDDAGASTRDVAWVSAHATSTRFNDAMEAAALRSVFGAATPAVHAAKPVLGHTLGASGLLEVALAAEVLRRGVRPPTSVPRALDEALAWVPLDREAAALEGRVALSINAAMAGHDTAVVLGAP